MIKKITIVSVFVILCSISLSSIGCIKLRKHRGFSDNTSEAEALLSVEISPSASVEWNTLCKKCGHTYSYFSNEGVIGLSRSEFEYRYPEWSIESFSRENVILKRSIDGYCPDHHIVFLEGDRIVVYSVVEPELNLEKLLDFDSAPFDLGAVEIAFLKKGVAFSSLKELDDYTDRFKKQQDKKAP